VVLPVPMVAAWLIARRHPDCVHARELARLQPEPPRGATDVNGPGRGGLPIAVRRRGLSLAVVGVGQRELRRALTIAAVVTVAVTAFSMGFGLVAAYQMADFGPGTGQQAEPLFFVFFALAGLVVGALAGLMAGVLTILTPVATGALTAQYEEFARRVAGAVEHEDQRFMGTTWPIPRRSLCARMTRRPPGTS